MYLFLDTETTGLPRSWNAPITDIDNWPRLVQVAWLLCDEAGAYRDATSVIISPKGFTIPGEATLIHGITHERALREGVDLTTTMKRLAEAIDRTELLVAHNMSFDEMIVGAEFFRTKVPHRLPAVPKFCTMKSSTDFCAIPSRHGHKWPTLSELHQRLFGRPLDGAHRADADVKACATCFFELKRRGLVSVA